MNLENITLQVCEVVKEVGEFIHQEAHGFKKTSVKVKSFNQLVSYVDKTAEEMLVKNLTGLLPEAGFITEEETITSVDKEYMWVIDPLDGTTNFVHQIPVYSISIGLLRNKKPVMGIVYEINREELFYAWEGSPAYLNGHVITVKPNADLFKSLMATGFPYYDFNLMDAYFKTLQELLRSTQGMRRMGSAAVDLAYVACGRFDGFFEYGLSPWDVAGGAFIVQQAGGTITDFSGTDGYIFGKEIIAASASIHPSFSGIIKKHFGK